MIGRAVVGMVLLALGQSPELEQRLDAGQRIVEGRKVLAAGHVDIGPRFAGDRWTLMIHDDAGGERVWRHTDQTVVQVTDDALLQVPDEPAYAFLHSQPGADVYVIPQTQDPEVVWVGWNTQDPEVMETIDRGVTMTMTGVEGPGSLVVYLQSGDFGEPKVLWDSIEGARPVWVDVNTHTHANWVFSEPGVYLVRVQIAADLVDGSTVTDTRELRFAVGSDTSTEQAFTAAWRGAPVAAPDSAPAPATAAAAERSEGTPNVLLAAIVVVGVALVAGLVVVLLRGNRAKQRARG